MTTKTNTNASTMATPVLIRKASQTRVQEASRYVLDLDHSISLGRGVMSAAFTRNDGALVVTAVRAGTDRT